MIALDRLSTITNYNTALANKALATALQQVSGITNLTLPQFALIVAPQQTTLNLPLIAAQTAAVSPETVANITTQLGTGTGNNGTLTMYDILGTAAGNSAPYVANVVSILANTSTVNLATTYATMLDVVTGVYGDPILGPVDIPTGAAIGIYSNATAAFSGESAPIPPVPPPPPDPPPPPSPVTGGTGLLPQAQTDITATVAANPQQVADLNANINAVADQAQTDKTNQALAQIDFTLMESNNRPIIYSFAQSLPEYGIDYTQYGTQQYIQATSDLVVIGGQAIVATMRQGSNQVPLESGGIQTTTAVPLAPNPPPPRANLLPG